MGRAVSIHMDLMPQPGNYIYKYTSDIYNSDEYKDRTNCYAYAFDIINDPVTGKSFDTWQTAYNSHGEIAFAAQPGLFSNQYEPHNNSIVSGTNVGNQKLVELVKDDAKAMGLIFKNIKPVKRLRKGLLCLQEYAVCHSFNLQRLI